MRASKAALPVAGAAACCAGAGLLLASVDAATLALLLLLLIVSALTEVLGLVPTLVGADVAAMTAAVLSAGSADFA